MLISDYVAWKGRFCAFDYTNFEDFMRYIFAQVMGQQPPIPDPWDATITVDALGNYFCVLPLLFCLLSLKFP